MEKTTDEMIKEAVDKMSEKFPNEDKSKYTEALEKILKKGDYPQDVLGFSDEFVEMLYAYAYKLFQSGKYEEAATAYRFLMAVSPLDIRHPMALAACFHKQKDYTQALSTYIMATFIDPTNPMPCYHASDCFLKLNNVEGAIEMLTLVIKKSAENETYATLKDRAELSLERLVKKQQEK